MNILGYKVGHDPAAALIVDGELVAAVEEERFNRIKHASGVFPLESINYCLEHAGLGVRDLDGVAFGRLPPVATMSRVAAMWLANFPRSLAVGRYAAGHMKTQVKGTLSLLRGEHPRTVFQKYFPEAKKASWTAWDHHLCHSASAFLCSPFEEAAILTYDGKGEATSTTIGFGKGANIRIRRRWPVPQSLGILYSSLTAYLGFEPNDGEYKLMGLAAYGQPVIDVSDVFRVAEDGYWIDPRFVLFPRSLVFWEKKYGPRRLPEAEVTEDQKNLAASFQRVFENVAVRLAELARDGRDLPICVSGGVGLNVKMNRAIANRFGEPMVWFQPVAGDAGNAIASAALLYAKLSGARTKPMATLALGPEYSNDLIEQAAREKGVTWTRIDDPAAVAAELVSQGSVVAWYQGRMEFGPRALGHRSIIADPREVAIRDRINEKIKYRELFRPFCPSMTKKAAEDFLVGIPEAPYMIVAFNATEAGKMKIPAVVHVDGTVRPQIVRPDWDPLYHRLIEEVGKRTGVEVVLNTSLNVRGEPIVCKPEDVVHFFLKTDVDAVVAGNILIKK